MTIATCPGCGERVFTIESWSDVDHCPACGRSLADPDAIGLRIRQELKREAGRFKRSTDPRVPGSRSHDQERSRSR